MTQKLKNMSELKLLIYFEYVDMQEKISRAASIDSTSKAIECLGTEIVYLHGIGGFERGDEVFIIAHEYNSSPDEVGFFLQHVIGFERAKARSLSCTNRSIRLLKEFLIRLRFHIRGILDALTCNMFIRKTNHRMMKILQKHGNKDDSAKYHQADVEHNYTYFQEERLLSILSEAGELLKQALDEFDQIATSNDKARLLNMSEEKYLEIVYESGNPYLSTEEILAAWNAENRCSQLSGPAVNPYDPATPFKNAIYAYYYVNFSRQASFDGFITCDFISKKLFYRPEYLMLLN